MTLDQVRELLAEMLTISRVGAFQAVDPVIAAQKSGRIDGLEDPIKLIDKLRAEQAAAARIKAEQAARFKAEQGKKAQRAKKRTIKMTRAAMEAAIKAAEGDKVAMMKIARLFVRLAMKGNLDAIDLMRNLIDGSVRKAGEAVGQKES